jgi:hypothetical protein
MIDSFWSRMQIELLDRRRWKTRVNPLEGRMLSVPARVHSVKLHVDDELGARPVDNSGLREANAALQQARQELLAVVLLASNASSSRAGHPCAGRTVSGY